MNIIVDRYKIIVFNTSKSYTFPPEFSFGDGGLLEVISQSCLELPLIHLWPGKNNTDSIVKKALSKIWLIRRMKKIQLDRNIILDYFLKEIRPVLKYAAPVWSSKIISVAQSSKIERQSQLTAWSGRTCRVRRGRIPAEYESLRLYIIIQHTTGNSETR